MSDYLVSDLVLTTPYQGNTKYNDIDSQLDSWETADKAMDAISEHLSRFGLDLDLDAYDAIQTELLGILKRAEVNKGRRR